MNFNYPGKYTDLKRFYIISYMKIMHNFNQEINSKDLNQLNAKRAKIFRKGRKNINSKIQLTAYRLSF